MTPRENNERIAKDIKVRSQLRYQKKNQIRLAKNHSKHTQNAKKCILCNPEPLILILPTGESRRIR